MSDGRNYHPPMPPSFGNPRENTANPIRPPAEGFLPLLPDTSALSLRNQSLTQLITNRSFTGLNQLRRGSVQRAQSYRRERMQRAEDTEDESDVELARSKTRFTLREDAEGTTYAGEPYVPPPPAAFALKRHSIVSLDMYSRRQSYAPPPSLITPEMRSQRLIGQSNPRYKWEQYYKTEEELKKMKKPLRKYYERNNYLIQQYLYIDKLLDSSLPHNLIDEYNAPDPRLDHIAEENQNDLSSSNGSNTPAGKVNRTKDMYKISADESTPLLSGPNSPQKQNGEAHTSAPDVPLMYPDEDGDSESSVVTFAIYLNLAANTILLIFKVIVTIMIDSMSVLASLVDAALDMLSTIIIWTTNRLIAGSADDTEKYPVGRQRLEPVGVLVFSVVMIVSFLQVGIQSFNKLVGDEHKVVELTVPAISIMLATVVLKGLCWFWCRLIKNSSVQALAQDAMTDVVFNSFSIVFPLVGYFFNLWWLDPLGGLLLSIYVVVSWCYTSHEHILNLTGHAATKDERNVILYLTMRFAHTIKYIQNCTAYHAGDKLNVEVDIVLDENMSLKDSHDLGESLQYVLESVPGVDRAWVHSDYKSINLPTHMRQT